MDTQLIWPPVWSPNPIYIYTQAAVVTRHSWYLVGQEQLICGALLTRLVTKYYDSGYQLSGSD